VKHLTFDGEYIDALLSGRKKATIRRSARGFKEGDLVYIHSGGYVIGKAIIKRIEKKRLGELTEEDARKDGFPSKKELVRALKRYYKGLEKDSGLYLIEFEMTEKFQEPVFSSDMPYDGYNPIEIAKLSLEKEIGLTRVERAILRFFLKSGSIRKAAIRMGGMEQRKVIREVLRTAYKLLKEKGFLSELKRSEDERGESNC